MLGVGDAIYKTECPRCGAVREDEQLGLEETPQEFVENLCKIFDEVWRVLADDGTIWVNLGDSYNSAVSDRSGSHGFKDGRTNRDKRLRAGGVEGLKQKDLVGIPWRFAFAMQERGWYLRQDIIWAKPNPMPESVTDRCTKSHEYIFLMSKSPRYYFDNEAIQEPAIHSNDRRAGQGRLKYDGKRQGEDGTGQEAFVSIKEFRNKRSVWKVGVARYPGAHFAVYPPALIEPCILAGSAEGDTVLDPFSGSGTTGEVALKNGRNYVGTELNPEYAAISEKRITDALGMFANVEMN
jgi:site-specific DNA-methyltransferase (adenine-specific)